MNRVRRTPWLAAGAGCATSLVAGLLLWLGLNCQGNQGGQTPLVPSIPSGLASGYRNHEYQFTTLSEDPDGKRVSCQFDWGDNTSSEWSELVANGSPVVMSKSWADTGHYFVRARAKDASENMSEWSAEHVMAIQDSATSQVPGIPLRPIGDTVTGMSRPEAYATMSVDPSAARIRYIFDWGDADVDTSGFGNSGDTCAASHMWQYTGQFRVRALALTEDGRRSDRWSDSLLVRVQPGKPPR